MIIAVQYTVHTGVRRPVAQSSQAATQTLHGMHGRHQGVLLLMSASTDAQ